MRTFKQDFPVFQKEPQLVFLDSAASAQKPKSVLDCLYQTYAENYANVHRGSCALATRATELYENARLKVARFINAPVKQIIFTKGATEGINLVAQGFQQLLQSGDEVLVYEAEHHADYVPWQQAALASGAVFKTFKVLPSGAVDLADFESKLSRRTKVVAVAHLSNVLGVENDVRLITQKAHDAGAKVLIDGAQSIAHLPIDVQEMGCDYFVFSGHKLYGPTGIGALFGTQEALEILPPYQFGGDMIKAVTFEKTTFAGLPNKFEAGTPPFVEAIGLGAAIDYVSEIGMREIAKEEEALTRLLTGRLKDVSGISYLGADLGLKKGIVSFTIKDIHPSDIAFALAKQHICVRVGHHCAMPVHKCFNKDVSVRVSLGVYNTVQDVDLFMEALDKAIRLFQ